MKLYERRDKTGKVVEWWTQRNIMGIYFSILPIKDGFSVVMNNEDANRAHFATAKTFSGAERLLCVAAQLESENKLSEKCVGCRFNNAKECRCDSMELCRKETNSHD